jgi:hypothetical protein
MEVDSTDPHAPKDRSVNEQRKICDSLSDAFTKEAKVTPTLHARSAEYPFTLIRTSCSNLATQTLSPSLLYPALAKTCSPRFVNQRVSVYAHTPASSYDLYLATAASTLIIQPTYAIWNTIMTSPAIPLSRPPGANGAAITQSNHC